MSDTSPSDQRSSGWTAQPTRRQRMWRMVGSVALMIVSSWAFYAWSSDSPSSRSGAPGFTESSFLHSGSNADTDRAAPADQAVKSGRGKPSSADGSNGDARFRRLIVGRWKQDSRERSLTVRRDGTATLVAEPGGVWSYLLADRLQFEIEWSIEDGRAVFHVTEGRPEAKAEIALNTWGREWKQVIEKLTPERLILIGEDGEDRRAWSRTETAGQSE